MQGRQGPAGSSESDGPVLSRVEGPVLSGVEGPVFVSACLAGRRCRWNGTAASRGPLRGGVGGRPVVLGCPEELGGLPTPREPCEIRGGDGHDVLTGRARVVTAAGVDVTTLFVQGAHAALRVAVRGGARHAILKSRSPSCGVGRIYDGRFRRRLRRGDGVTTALFRAHGITVATEEALPGAAGARPGPVATRPARRGGRRHA